MNARINNNIYWHTLCSIGKRIDDAGREDLERTRFAPDREVGANPKAGTPGASLRERRLECKPQFWIKDWLKWITRRTNIGIYLFRSTR